MVREFTTFGTYLGHKTNENKYIKDIIEKLDLSKIEYIIEPFCGMFGFSYYFYDKFKDKKFIFIDNNETLIRFFNDVKLNGLNKYLDYVKENAYKLYEDYNNWLELKRKIERNNNNNDFSLYEYFLYWRLVGHAKTLHYYNSKRCDNIKKHLDSIVDISRYNKLLDIINISEFIYGDYSLIINNKEYDNEKYLIYLDPPYLDSYNRDYSSYKKINNSDGYIIDNTKLYIDIKYMFDSFNKSKLIMILNKNAIIDYLFNDYIYDSYNKIYQSFKKKSIHNIICKNI